jgi:hypothetical protein
MDMNCLFDAGPKTTIKIIAGDVPTGNWDLRGSRLAQPPIAPRVVGESIVLAGNIRRLDVKDLVNKDNFEPFVGAGVGALLGFRLFGVLGAVAGAVAGHLLTKDGPEVSVRCELNDGRKFIAVMSPELYQKLVDLK